MSLLSEISRLQAGAIIGMSKSMQIQCSRSQCAHISTQNDPEESSCTLGTESLFLAYHFSLFAVDFRNCSSAREHLEQGLYASWA